MLGRFGTATRASSSALLGRLAAQSLRPGRLVSVAGLHTTPSATASASERSVRITTESHKVVLSHKHYGSPNKETTRNFPNLWLRDNCQCQQCINQDTRQRNFDTFQLPTDIKPVSLEETPDHLFVTWSDSHKSQHPWSWLDSWLPRGLGEQFGRDDYRLPWTSEETAHSPPEVEYDALMSESSDKGIAELTKNIWVRGFSFVVNTPPTPEATEAVLEKIGPIRTTHYGGFYDFIPDLALADTAYTNLALPAHTDTTYFTEPAGLQAFHLLSHTPPPNASPSDDVLGGQSLLVDGFNAAFTLKKEDPASYRLLSKVKLPWHASGNKGIAIVPDQTYPVFEVDGLTLNRVRWNNDDRGIVNMWDAEVWYKAAAKWNEILRRKTSEYWFQLEPGRVVIFDNWRVLHGRSAFEGVRRICGGYIPRDDFVSRYRTTNFPQDSVLGRNLNMRTRKMLRIRPQSEDDGDTSKAKRYVNLDISSPKQ
ncbi:Fc.00g050410.m01.CDS01 [Cosmosporella sp. VM-42]